MSRVVVFVLFILVGCVSGCLRPPPNFISTHDEAGTWANIEVRDGLRKDKEALWRKTVDTLTAKFDLEVLEKESGYIRTSWKYTYVQGNQVVDRYRARIIVKFKGEVRRTSSRTEVVANFLPAKPRPTIRRYLGTTFRVRR